MKIRKENEPFRQKYTDRVIREISHGIKDRDPQALKMMTHFILDDGMIRKGDLIIPAPQHEGKAIYTLQIAEMIADETGAVVIDILHSKERKTMYEQKLSGTVSAPLFIADYKNLPKNKRIFFLDNVIDTGATLKAAERAVGRRLTPLVYSYTDRAPDNLVEERSNAYMARNDDMRQNNNMKQNENLERHKDKNQNSNAEQNKGKERNNYPGKNDGRDLNESTKPNLNTNRSDDIRHDSSKGRIRYQKQYNREDSIFVRVKAAVTVKEAAAFYNVPMNRAGLTKCLFHPDEHPSMLLRTRYYCFGCETTGDVIDFTARLFNLRPIDAAKRLANDFGVPIGHLTEQDRENFKKKISIRNQLTPKEQLKKDIKWATRVCTDYKAILEQQKKALEPKTMEEGFSDEFGKLVKDISKVDGDLDYLLTATNSELRGFIDQKQSWFKALEELVRRDRMKILDLSKGVSL